MIKRNFQNIETNGVRLRIVVEGQGPLVIMVHGWPQCWYLWRHMIDPVVAAGSFLSDNINFIHPDIISEKLVDSIKNFY